MDYTNFNVCIYTLSELNCQTVYNCGDFYVSDVLMEMPQEENIKTNETTVDV